MAAAGSGPGAVGGGRAGSGGAGLGGQGNYSGGLNSAGGASTSNYRGGGYGGRTQTDIQKNGPTFQYSTIFKGEAGGRGK